MRRVAAVAAVLTTIGLAFARAPGVLTPGTDPGEPLTQVEVAEVETQRASGVPENDALRSHLAHLEGRLAALRAEMKDAAALPALAARSATSPPLEIEPDRPAPTADPNGERDPMLHLEQLERRLASEGEDVATAIELEAAFRDGLADLPGSSLVSMRCGTSLCRTDFAFETAEERDEAMRLVPSLVPWEADGFGGADPSDPDRVVLYVLPHGASR